ncbi:transposase [Yersinia frederiksenii]|nr:transposase [Yersinia frederiksenii]
MIDLLLTARRDAVAALRFFRKAIRPHGEPEVVPIDKSGANTAALATEPGRRYPLRGTDTSTDL